MQGIRFGLPARIVVAAAAISAILLIASHQLFPQVPIATQIGYSLLGLIVVCAISFGGALAYATVNQFVLRKGGTDTQWFWFSGEPRGLRALRSDRARVER